MRFARLGPVGAEFPVLQHEDASYDLRTLTADLDADFLADDGLGRAQASLADGRLERVENVDALRVGAPIARPGKIVCIGLNYRDHAEETKAEIPAEPIIFMKAVNTVVGPEDDVLIPRGSEKTDYEVELAIVLKARARYLESDADALACVAGYVISNDVSEREFQLERGGQWDKGKSCETFNPLGPWLVTPDEVEDPHVLRRDSR